MQNYTSTPSKLSPQRNKFAHDRRRLFPFSRPLLACERTCWFVALQLERSRTFSCVCNCSPHPHAAPPHAQLRCASQGESAVFHLPGAFWLQPGVAFMLHFVPAEPRPRCARPVPASVFRLRALCSSLLRSVCRSIHTPSPRPLCSGSTPLLGVSTPGTCPRPRSN